MPLRVIDVNTYFGVLSSSKKTSHKERNRRHHPVSFNDEGVVADVFGQVHEFFAMLARLEHLRPKQIGIPQAAQHRERIGLAANLSA